MSFKEFFKVEIFNMEPDFLKLKNDMESGSFDPSELEEDDEEGTNGDGFSDYEEKKPKPKKKKNQKQLAYCFEEKTIRDYEELMNSFDKKEKGEVKTFISEETFYSSPFNIIRTMVKYRITIIGNFDSSIKF